MVAPIGALPGNGTRVTIPMRPRVETALSVAPPSRAQTEI